jgi:hypothetical protein
MVLENEKYQLCTWSIIHANFLPQNITFVQFHVDEDRCCLQNKDFELADVLPKKKNSTIIANGMY